MSLIHFRELAVIHSCFPRFVLGWLLVVGAAPLGFAQTRDLMREARLKMVTDAIEREGVKNSRVLASMRQVPRHEFVPLNLRAQAYYDTALAIGNKQTISPPFIVAYMTETIDPQPDDKVLEIGTGSGYQAAVLSNLCKEVYSIEIVEPLGKTAAERLKKLGYANVKCLVGDGYKGWAEHAPFDKVIVTCSPESIPRPLIEQLKEGGKMIIPLGERYQQVFHLLEKKDGKLVAQKLIPTLFVPMTGVSEDNRQKQPDPLHPHWENTDFEVDGNDDGIADFWHYQRQTTLVEGKAPSGKRYLQIDNAEPGRMAQALQGTAVNGAKIGSFEISLQYKVENVRFGTNPQERPSVMIHFYDELRRDIADEIIGPWQGTSDWDKVTKSVPVPLKAREAIIRLGLHGATGRLCIDDIHMTPKPR